MDYLEQNRRSWNAQARRGSRWCTPVSGKEVEAARRGKWQVILTPNKPVPRQWFPDSMHGLRVLCLASAGGQQAPILAAAGAHVTSYDLSDEMLALDQKVCEENGLDLVTVQGDMQDLSALASETFDLIFHPESNLYVPDVQRVWRECARVLVPGGALLAGMMNPAFFLFDHEEAEERGELTVRYRQPHNPFTSFSEAERASIVENGEALEFGHTLEDLLGGQLEARLSLTHLYEDDWDDEATPLNRFSSTSLATRSVRMRKKTASLFRAGCQPKHATCQVRERQA